MRVMDFRLVSSRTRDRWGDTRLFLWLGTLLNHPVERTPPALRNLHPRIGHQRCLLTLRSPLRFHVNPSQLFPQVLNLKLRYIILNL